MHFDDALEVIFGAFNHANHRLLLLRVKYLYLSLLVSRQSFVQVPKVFRRVSLGFQIPDQDLQYIFVGLLRLLDDCFAVVVWFLSRPVPANTFILDKLSAHFLRHLEPERLDSEEFFDLAKEIPFGP